MHHPKVSTNYPWLPHNADPANNPTPPEYKDMPIQPLGDRQSEFEDFMNGCVEYYGEKGKRCWQNEDDRIIMSLRQPKSMVNFTEHGFTKIRAPEAVYKLLQEFWAKNRNSEKKENWPTGNVYVNHWENPTSMVSVEDESLEGGGFVLKQHIWNAARDTISEWTGQQLAECSLYGIRVYKEGAVLAPHVDRLPLVSSAIINVDQDVDEPWPLEVIGHDGKAHNVTMVPGDMILYESHSILHGRPFPLKGRFMANVFIHFEPIGKVGDVVTFQQGGLPPYVVPGSEEEENWWRNNPSGHKLLTQRGFDTGSTEAHRYANMGDFEKLKEILDKNNQLVNKKDKNGWTPLHEAVRDGNLEVIDLLLNRGADVNARTGPNGEGGSALYLAMEHHREDEDDEESEVELFLKKHNAKLVEPDL